MTATRTCAHTHACIRHKRSHAHAHAQEKNLANETMLAKNESNEYSSLDDVEVIEEDDRKVEFEAVSEGFRFRGEIQVENSTELREVRVHLSCECNYECVGVFENF
jgi:hypothetical protein